MNPVVISALNHAALVILIQCLFFSCNCAFVLFFSSFRFLGIV